MRTSVFVGTSVDGYIAREDGSLDFLPHDDSESHGYDEFLASVDALVIGRATYETVLGFGVWPYGDKRVYVLSSRPLPPPPSGATIHQLGGEPAEVVAALVRDGVQHAYVDGGITVQRFLRAGLIDRLILTHVPVLIGSGRPLFGTLPADVRLRAVATRQFSNGLVQTEYIVERPAMDPATA